MLPADGADGDGADARVAFPRSERAVESARALSQVAPPVYGEVRSVGAGEYTASFRVDLAGNYLLEVRVGRELIAGAPFRLSVRAGI